MRQPYQHTGAWSTYPLTKQISRNENGEIVSIPARTITHARAKRVETPNAFAFAEILTRCNPFHVFWYGVSEQSLVTVVTKDALKRISPAHRDEYAARTQKDFPFIKNTPGWLCFDYDPQDGVTPLCHDELRERLIIVCPEIKNAPMAFAHSTSSYIYYLDDNGVEQCYRGDKGKRIYVGLADMSDIKRFGTDIFNAFWDKGWGWFEFSTTGSKLAKTYYDRAMRSSHQPDFVGGAYCTNGVYQRRPDPIVVNGDNPPFESRAWKYERKVVEKASKATKGAKAEVKKEENTDCDAKNAVLTIEESKLTRDTVIHFAEGGEETLGRIMLNRQKCHGQIVFDPCPTKGKPVHKAILHVNSTNPCIWTWAHGGVRYLIPLSWRNPPPKSVRGFGAKLRPASKPAQAPVEEPEPEGVE
ncbi:MULTISPECIES: hypothetical protein [Solidesulfovibrio]|uniref:hypothetical protein n=1 Tax=Solidesulfovibrio TaxID=2910984 RepID=UPI001010C00B|nr:MULTISPECIES: hypothetical protein [Solidesulfovibrio]